MPIGCGSSSILRSGREFSLTARTLHSSCGRSPCQPAELRESMTTQTRPLKILHILDHSLPMHSGYAYRSDGIFQAQRKRGWLPEDAIAAIGEIGRAHV